MNEVLTRVSILASVSGIVWLIAWRVGRSSDSRRLSQDLLEPGVYLFSSETCSACQLVRDRLISELGADGFDEVAWESQGEVFDALAIDKVPSVLQVGPRRKSTLSWGASAETWVP